MNETLVNILQKGMDWLNNSYVQTPAILIHSMLLSLAMVLVIWIAEIFVVGLEHSGARQVFRKPTLSTYNDIIFFILHVTGAVVVLSWIATLGIPMLIRTWVRQEMHFDIDGNLPPAIQMVIYLVMLDCLNYWQHRLMHRYPSLWQIHSYHHSASEFNTITVFREHPLDKALNTLMSIIPAAILGVPPEQYPYFITIYGVVGYLKHSKLPWRMGWFGKYVIQSPIDHWIHHSTQRAHFDQNFANVFAIWDHIFGTYYKGVDINSEIGLPESPYTRQGPFQNLINVWVRFVRALLPAKAPTVVANPAQS